MNNNRETLNSYESHIQEYIDGTPREVSSFVKDWIDESLGYVSQGGTVLELGSAFGRDADYIEQAGYTVRRTDATKGFVELLRSQGNKADVLNAITDDLGGPYDMIFADAVLLHFPVDEFKMVLSKVHDSLKQNGIFAFTVKQGDGSEWSSDKLGAPRFFQYWRYDSLEAAVVKASFTPLKLTADLTEKWLQVIARKQTT